MRPDRIEIAGLEKVRAKAQRYFDAMARSRPRRDEPEETPKREPVVFRDSSGRRVNRPALQGYACLYDTAAYAGGEFVVFKIPCFSSMMFDFDNVKLLIDHDPKQVVATTGLSFETTSDGLAFRITIDEGSPSAAIIRDCLADSERACVSVGCEILQSETKKVAGVDVRYITRASLKEISLVKLGAVPETFVSLVSLDEVDPSLVIEARSPRFGREKAAANMSARCRRICDAIRSLG